MNDNRLQLYINAKTRECLFVVRSLKNSKDQPIVIDVYNRLINIALDKRDKRLGATRL